MPLPLIMSKAILESMSDNALAELSRIVSDGTVTPRTAEMIADCINTQPESTFMNLLGQSSGKMRDIMVNTLVNVAIENQPKFKGIYSKLLALTDDQAILQEATIALAAMYAYDRNPAVTGKLDRADDNSLIRRLANILKQVYVSKHGTADGFNDILKMEIPQRVSTPQSRTATHEPAIITELGLPMVNMDSPLVKSVQDTKSNSFKDDVMQLARQLNASSRLRDVFIKDGRINAGMLVKLLRTEPEVKCRRKYIIVKDSSELDHSMTSVIPVSEGYLAEGIELMSNPLFEAATDDILYENIVGDLFRRLRYGQKIDGDDMKQLTVPSAMIKQLYSEINPDRNPMLYAQFYGIAEPGKKPDDYATDKPAFRIMQDNGAESGIRISRNPVTGGFYMVKSKCTGRNVMYFVTEAGRKLYS